MFELFKFTFICNLESFSFASWRSVNFSTTFLGMMGKRRGGVKKLRNTFQRLRPQEFSSGDFAGDFGLRSNILRMCTLIFLIFSPPLPLSLPFIPILKISLLRPPTESLNEKSSGRSLWKVFLNFFRPSPPLQIKLGGPTAVNCSGIIIQYFFHWLSIFSQYKDSGRNRATEKFTDRHLANENADLGYTPGMFLQRPFKTTSSAHALPDN